MTARTLAPKEITLYETPSFDQSTRAYRVVLSHKTIVPSGDLVCELQFGSLTPDLTDQVMQDFVDLVAAAEKFAIVYANKATPSVQTITPTTI